MSRRHRYDIAVILYCRIKLIQQLHVHKARDWKKHNQDTSVRNVWYTVTKHICTSWLDNTTARCTKYTTQCNMTTRD